MSFYSLHCFCHLYLLQSSAQQKGLLYLESYSCQCLHISPRIVCKDTRQKAYRMARVAEIGVGSCFVRMPTLSKLLAYHIPPYEKLKSWMSSYCSSAKSKIASISFRSPSGLWRLFESSSSIFQGHNSYLDLGNNKDVRLRKGAPGLPFLPYEMGPVKTFVHTVISKGNILQVQEDGNKLKVNLKQNSQRYGEH